MSQSVLEGAGGLARPREAAGAGSLFAPGFRETSAWLDDVGPPPPMASAAPAAADVVVIGSGYTGLNAALETARAGRHTVVLEAGDAGGGCSTRNGGQISTSVKPEVEALARRHGQARAEAVRQAGLDALDWIETLVAREGLDCDFAKTGRFHAAHTPAAYEALARSAEAGPKCGAVEAAAVPRAEIRSELGTDLYFGGVVYARHAALHPAKYHRGLLERVLAAGAEVVPHTAALAIERDGRAFRVATPSGEIRARDVVVATNGYTSALTPWLRRRVIPIGSYIIATEPLEPALMDRLFPTGRVTSDTRKVVYYFRASPDRRRVVFGGRVAAAETDPRASAPLLHAELTRIFPELAGTKVSHSWLGFVAYTFDEIAHTGCHEGIHYAMGYCGSGVSMASFLGMRMGQKVLGLKEGRTPFDDLPFPTRPLYHGRPWFLPAAVAFYRWRDARELRRAHAAHG